MGYRSEKETQEKTVKRLRLGLVIGTCILFAALCVVSAFVPVESWKYYWDLPSVSLKEEGELRIHYLDVENGGCALVELPDGKNVIVLGRISGSSAQFWRLEQLTTQTMPEVRNYFRQQFTTEAVVMRANESSSADGEGSNAIPCSIRDISGGGVLLSCEKQYEKGDILFLSDLVLGIWCFHTEKMRHADLNWLLYFPGQLLIALGIGFL